MAETVNAVERHIVLLAELFQPAVRGLIVHGLAVPLDEQPVALYPLVAQAKCFFVLLVFQLFENTHDIRTDLQYTLGTLGLCGVGIAPTEPP